MQGATVVMMTPQGFRGEGVFANFWRIVDHFNITTFSGVPTVYSALLQQPVGDSDISSLVFCMCGAAPMPVETFKSFEREVGVRILEGYGLTEGTCVSSINPTQGESRVGSIGIRIPYQQMMCGLTTAQGTVSRCNTDDVGSVLICGDNVFKGYCDEAQNQRLWFTDAQGQQWLDTGDMGRQDADGYFWLTGRTKELIIRGGHNIEPKLIEEVMCTHPAVALAAAVGTPDIHAGELPVCYVQLKAGSTVTAQVLLEFAQLNISERAAIPKNIYIIDALPITAVGKIFKPALEMQQIERCVKAVISRLLPDTEYSVYVSQDKKLGLLATIELTSNDTAVAELKAELGRYTFKVLLPIDKRA
ncbi:MAG: fatty-acyl-CoA synthase [Phenylobacterium sp.]|jgi:fatty-acyl-CoA synthase